MKQGLAISFLFIYFLALLNPISPFINYTLNKAEIIEKFCENKDKPVLACEGQCHLKKQIEKKSKEQDQNEESSRIEIISPVGKIHSLNITNVISFDIKKTIPVFNECFENIRSIKIDYPPQWA